MYRNAALPSAESLDAAVTAAVRVAHRARVAVLVGCVAAGVGAGLFALDRLQIWAHVFVLTYASLGLGVGYLLYRGVGLPLLHRFLDRRLARVASRHGVDASELVVAHAYLV